MSKAIISNRIYLSNPGPERTKEITKALTYKLAKQGTGKQFAAVETIKNYKILPKGIISIPQGRQDLIPAEYEVVDKRLLVPVPFPVPKFELRDTQVPVFEEVSDTVFINAKVGWGKTTTSLHLARKFGQKTLVITHTTALRDQWRDEVKLLYGVEPGVIGSGKVDYEDHFITIANVQTLVKHAESLAKEFGTIILDEAHHCPATTFSSIIDSFYARYRIALSGTMIRKDGKHVVFKDYFGDHVVKPPASHTLAPLVRLVNTGLMLNPGATWVEKINELASDEKYQQFIAALALSEIEEGHQVLVIADRVDFLERVHEFIGSETSLLVTGNTSYEERQDAKRLLLEGHRQAVCGSRQIFSEGISINSLSCVILAIPMSNDALLEQIIGRIQRLHDGKLNPLVLDMQFKGFADRKQNTDRLGFYMRSGWQIETV
jgi:superfamily II DNA or RNA helicase